MRTSIPLVTAFVCLLFAIGSDAQPLPRAPGSLAKASEISVDVSSMTNCDTTAEDDVQECLEALDTAIEGISAGSGITTIITDSGSVNSATITLAGDGGTISTSATASTITITGPAESGHAIQDETVALTQRGTLNFTGAGVECTDNPGGSRTDCTISGGGGGSSIVLDLGDDASNESTGLLKIVTDEVTPSIFTEPSADTLGINTAQPWPTATALAANGANCSAGNAPLGVNASGASEGCFDAVSIVQDTTPQLGGNLDLNSSHITIPKNVSAPADVEEVYCRSEEPTYDPDDASGDVSYCSVIAQSGVFESDGQEMVHQLRYNRPAAGGYDNTWEHSFDIKTESGFAQGVGGSTLVEHNWDTYSTIFSHTPTSVSGTFEAGELVTFATTGAEARVMGICTGADHGANGTEGANPYQWCSDKIADRSDRCSAGATCSEITASGLQYLMGTATGDNGAGGAARLSEVNSGDSYTGDDSLASANSGTFTRLAQGFSQNRLHALHWQVDNFKTFLSWDTNFWNENTELVLSGTNATSNGLDWTITDGYLSVQREFQGSTDSPGSPGIVSSVTHTALSGDGPASRSLVRLDGTVKPASSTSMGALNGIVFNYTIDDSGITGNSWGSTPALIEANLNFGPSGAVKPTMGVLQVNAPTGTAPTNYSVIYAADHSGTMTGNGQQLMKLFRQDANDGRGMNILMSADGDSQGVTEGGHFAWGFGGNVAHMAYHFGIGNSGNWDLLVDSGSNAVPGDGDDPYPSRQMGLFTVAAADPVDTTDPCDAATPTAWKATTSGRWFVCGTIDDTWVELARAQKDVVTTTVTGPTALTAAQMRDTMHIANHGTGTSQVDYTLPAAAAGLLACFYDLNSGAGVVTIDPVDGVDTIVLDGSALTAGNAIDSPGAAGDSICLMAIDATNWVTLNRVGTWIDGGTD